MASREFSIRESVFNMRSLLWTAIGFFFLSSTEVTMAADAWKILIPTAAQGSTDVLTRALAKKMADDLGEAVEVENMPGLSGTKAAHQVFAASPEAKMLMMATVSSHAIAFGLKPAPAYKADDFSPIALIGTAPYLLMVSPASPHRQAQDLFDASRRSSMSYSSTGINGPHHLVAELIAKQAQVQWVHKPYSGGAQALQAVSDGAVDFMLPASILALPRIKDGSSRVLATTGSQRTSALPAVPTISELGLPGLSAESWYVLVGPPGMPASSMERLEKAVAHAVQDSQYLKLLESNGVDAKPMERGQINAFLDAESKKWGGLVLQLGGSGQGAAGRCEMALNQLKAAQQSAMASRDTLITTRRQAQDFKNVLLRFWSSTAQAMQARLADRNTELESLVRGLEISTQTGAEHARLVGTIRAESTKIATTYTAAIVKLDPADRLSIFAADDHAKGVDVAIFRALEKLVALTTTQLEDRRNQVIENCH